MHSTLKIFLALLLLFTTSYGYARMVAGFSSGATLLDAFTYDDGELELKSSGNFVRWATHVDAGVFNVDTGKVKYASGTGAGFYVHKTTFLSANVYSQIKLDTIAAGMDVGLYVNAQGQGSATQDGYVLAIYDNAGTKTLEVYEVADGVWGAAKTSDAITSYAAGDVFRFANESGTLKAYKNGTIISGLTVADATYTEKRVGFTMAVSGAATRLDDWEGGDVR